MPRLTGPELSERAKAARAAKAKAEQPIVPAAVTISPDLNEFTGQMGSTFGPGGTFFNPQNVFDPRLTVGVPFPGGNK